MSDSNNSESSSPSSNSESSSRSSSPELSSTGLSSPDIDWYEGLVLDIGGSRMQDSMKAELDRKFLWKYGKTQKHRVMPASVLHSEAGLRMWANINRMPDYYQTREEIALLKQNGKELAKHLAPSCVLVDLGSGDIRKVEPLLDILDSMQIRIQYYALDLSRSLLVESMRVLRPRYRNVHCYGLWGTFDDCLQWAKTIQSPKCYMSLGSMFGNDHFESAVQRLQAWTKVMKPDDSMLLGLDATQNRDSIWRSYHDEGGLFHDFIRSGLEHSNDVLGHVWYRPEDWEVLGEFQATPLMHHFTIRAKQDVRCDALGLIFRRDQKIVCYEGFKYEPSAMEKQFAAAGLTNSKQWSSPSGQIVQYLLCRAPLASSAQAMHAAADMH